MFKPLFNESPFVNDHLWMTIYGWPYMNDHIWMTIYEWPYMNDYLWMTIYEWPSSILHKASFDWWKVEYLRQDTIYRVRVNQLDDSTVYHVSKHSFVSIRFCDWMHVRRHQQLDRYLPWDPLGVYMKKNEISLYWKICIIESFIEIDSILYGL